LVREIIIILILISSFVIKKYKPIVGKVTFVFVEKSTTR